ncbi:MAG TPA: hypothetical protein QF818_05070, partial [Prochlorococcaceae cyanobacterium Fu_MAG_72]|nr:hypothetical protein [Prochlorococcaceae cyanobacterium Fu_MAG_72]
RLHPSNITDTSYGSESFLLQLETFVLISDRLVGLADLPISGVDESGHAQDSTTAGRNSACCGR